MGRVFLGRSAGGRLVAVKVIRDDLAADPEFRVRFGREVAAAKRVGGLFTALVVDADVDGPVPWLAAAYVAGPSLADAISEHGPLPPESVLSLAAGLAEGLGAIHAAGLVHRDLKPSNVLLADDGPRVIDFGISRAAEASALTRTGLVVGSPGFMSPEQAEGGEVGPASDVFSLGAVLVFAATGMPPFGTGSTAALVYRVVHSPPRLDDVPAQVRSIAERCLAKDPGQRPTPAELLAEVGDVDLTDNWLPTTVLDGFAQHAPTDPRRTSSSLRYVPTERAAHHSSPKPAADAPYTVTAAPRHQPTEAPAAPPPAAIPAAVPQRRNRRPVILIGLLAIITASATTLVLITVMHGPVQKRGGQGGSTSASTSGTATPRSRTQSVLTWNALTPSLPPGTPKKPSAGLYAISCPTAVDCVAAGTVQDDNGNSQALFETLARGSWSPKKVAFSGGASGTTLNNISGIACPKLGSCVATGSTYIPSGPQDQGLIYTLSDGTWTQSIAPLPPHAAVTQQTVLDGIACPAPGTCVAVGGYNDANHTSQGLIETLSGGTWIPSQAPLPVNATGDGGLTGIACPAPGACVAVGAYKDQNHINQGFIETLKGGTWTPSEAPRVTTALANKGVLLTNVACSTSRACIATGQYNYTNFRNPSSTLFETLSNGAWTPSKPPAPQGTSPTGVFLDGLTCLTDDSCIATGSYNLIGQNNSDHPLIETFSQGVWKLTKLSIPAGDNSAALSAIDCPQIAICVAAGNSNAANGSINALIETSKTSS